MTPQQELDEMRRQYPFAARKTHMLVRGVVRLRCAGCRVRPVPRDWFVFVLCERCLDGRLTAAGLAPAKAAG